MKYACPATVLFVAAALLSAAPSTAAQTAAQKAAQKAADKAAQNVARLDSAAMDGAGPDATGLLATTSATATTTREITQTQEAKAPLRLHIQQAQRLSETLAPWLETRYRQSAALSAALSAAFPAEGQAAGAAAWATEASAPSPQAALGAGRSAPRPGSAAQPTPQPYPLGLAWQRPSQRAAEQVLANALNAALNTAGNAPLDATSGAATTPGLAAAQRRARLRAWLKQLPITGRLLLPLNDAHLLQAHPDLDPLLQPGDVLVLPDRPSQVRVLLDDGELCVRPFVAAQEAPFYLAQCPVRGAVDQVFIVQPEGRVTAVGVAPWNISAQPAPAPGAWLWVPSRDAGWTPQLNTWISQRLAAQGIGEGLGEGLAHEIAQGQGGRFTQEVAQGVAQNSALVAAPVEQGAPTRTPQAAQRPQEWSASPVATAAHARDPVVLPSDWGVAGLLQTPSARSPAAGSVALALSRSWPYTQMNVVLSPFDSIEVALRYTGISNRLYGADIAGDQSYKDKSSEVKWRFLDETANRPALALGLRDPGGTGLFGGEYLVASKRWGDLDWSLGLGWGYLGGRADLPNPLAALSPRMAQRSGLDVGRGGTAHLGALFTGRTALFGGLQWQLPGGPWVLRAEWEGNNYAHEPLGSRLPQRSPLNASLTWNQGPWAVSLGFERGQQWMLGLSLNGSLPALRVPKLAPAPRGAVQALPPEPAPQAETMNRTPDGTVNRGQVAASTTATATATASVPSPAATDAILQALSEQTGWQAQQLVMDGSTWRVNFDQATGYYARERLERALAVLHRAAPLAVRHFDFQLLQRGVQTAQHRVDRRAWVAPQTRWLPPEQALGDAPALPGLENRSQTVSTVPISPPTSIKRAQSGPHGGISLGYQQHLGGPDGYLYALSLRAQADWTLRPGWWLQGSLGVRLADNYARFQYTAPSALPRVRTAVREYLTSARVTLPNAQITQLSQWSESVYSLAYAGWLEAMFAGAGAEVMWRPQGGRWALSLDINHVAQRNFRQDLGLRDYRVSTGHAVLHWDTGWQDLLAQLSAGQYLAGDRGATLELSKVFRNGTRMGVWATKTNVSAAQFGEGSFDKGVYVSIPFDALFTQWSGQSTTLAWQPLIRDGGARLQRAHTLWGLTAARDARALHYNGD